MSNGRGPSPKLLDAIYATIAAPQTWPDLLREAGDYLGAECGFMLGPALPRIAPVPLFAYNLDVSAIMSAYPKYAGRAEFTTRALATGRAPGAFLLEELFPLEEQAESDFWRDIVEPLKVTSGVFIVVRSPEEGERPIVMGFYRRTGASFAQSDLEQAELLLPHLRRALSVLLDAPATGALPAGVATLTDAIGAPCFIVDSSGRVVHRNHAADLVLQAGDGVALNEQVLELSDEQANLALSAKLAAIGATAWSGQFKLGGEILATRPSGGAAMVLVVAPLGLDNPIAAVATGARSAVFVLEEKLRMNGLLPERLQRLYGLTTAETAVSVLLASGLSINEIAAERGTVVETVRSQIKTALAKTGARRQADLASLVNRLRF